MEPPDHVAAPSVFGPYQLVRPIGAGSQGAVYLAVQTSLERRVALKLLNQTLLDQHYMRRFQREIQVSAKLNHRNIVKIYDGGFIDNTGYIAMELLDGKTLQDLLDTGNPIDVATTVAIAIDLADGIDCLHTNSLVHRDIKPANVMITSDNVTKLLDFGLCRTAASTVITEAGGIVGTPQYLAPEILEGTEASPASDMWALGCILYQLLTRRMPFPDCSGAGWVRSILMDPILDLRRHNPGVPAGLAELVMSLVDRNAAQRLASAGFLRDSLKNLELTEPPPPLSEQKPARRSRSSGALKRPSVTPAAAQAPAPRRPWLLAVACAACFATFLLLRRGHSPKPVTLRPTPQASKQPLPHRRPGLFDQWRQILPHLEGLRRGGPTAKEIAAKLDGIGSVQLGKNPALWLHWVRLGEWLDDPKRSPAPPAGSGAGTGNMDSEDEGGFQSELRNVIKAEPGEIAVVLDGRGKYSRFLPGFLRTSLRMTGYFPQDPIGWFLLARGLDVDGPEAEAGVLYRLGLERLGNRRLEKWPWVWPGLARAHVLTPGHDLVKEWPDRVHLHGNVDDAWMCLFSCVDQKLAEATLERGCRDLRVAEQACGVQGQRFLDARLPRDAIRSWTKGLELVPRSPTLHRRLGNLCLNMGDVDGAQVHLQRGTPTAWDRLRWAYVAGPPEQKPPQLTTDILLGSEQLVRLCELRRFIEMGDVAGAAKLARYLRVPGSMGPLSWITTLAPESIEGPIALDLLGAGRKDDWLLDFWQRKFLPASLGIPTLLDAVGCLNTPAGTPYLEELLQTLEQRMSSSALPHLMRAVWASRRREFRDSFAALAKARQMNGYDQLRPYAFEIFLRPTWLDLLGQTTGLSEDIIARTHRNFIHCPPSLWPFDLSGKTDAASMRAVQEAALDFPDGNMTYLSTAWAVLYRDGRDTYRALLPRLHRQLRANLQPFWLRRELDWLATLVIRPRRVWVTPAATQVTR
jgi:serine/threonine protein kinase